MTLCISSLFILSIIWILKTSVQPSVKYTYLFILYIYIAALPYGDGGMGTTLKYQFLHFWHITAAESIYMGRLSQCNYTSYYSQALDSPFRNINLQMYVPLM